MNTPAGTDPVRRPLRTSDLAAAGSRAAARELDEETQPPIEADEVEANEVHASDVQGRDVQGRDVQGGDVQGSDVQASGVHAREAQAGEAQPNELQARESRPAADSERLDPLFSPDLAQDYRSRWTAVQSSFVDDPRRAVQQGDELVAQVMQSLAETFADERDKLEEQLGQTDDASTETLRVALRRYRSFFERLLSL